jgi:hypothetical protein
MENIFLSEKCTHNSKSHVYEQIFRRGGHGDAEINQHDLVCGEEVRVELRTSGSTGHRKVSRGCAYSSISFFTYRLTGAMNCTPTMADINKVSVYHCEMPANPVLARDYAKLG